MIAYLANKYGFYPWDWEHFSWWQKFRIWWDTKRLRRGKYCFFVEDRGRIWLGQSLKFKGTQCECSFGGKRSVCKCTVDADGVLRRFKDGKLVCEMHS